MNSKILVEVLVPAAGESFDVYIPLDIRMSEALTMISSLVNGLCEGRYHAGKDAILCDAETGIIFNIDMLIIDLGLKTGSRLMLI